MREGLAPWFPGSLPCLGPRQKCGWGGKAKGFEVWCLHPLPEPPGREGQLGLEAPRANSDLLLALPGSGERA